MKYCIFVCAITTFSRIYLCNGVLEQSLRVERSATADEALKPIRLSRLSLSNSDGKRVDLTSRNGSSSIDAHILKGVANCGFVQLQANVQQYQLHQQRQQEKSIVNHNYYQQHLQRQQRQPQQPQTMQTKIGNNPQMPMYYDQQILQAEQQLRHQHKRNFKLSGQSNNRPNNNAHFEDPRNYENNDKRNADVEGHHIQIESTHNYDISYKVGKENSPIIRNLANNIDGDDISMARNTPEPAIIDAAKLTAFSKEPAITTPPNTTLKPIASTDSRQSATEVTPTFPHLPTLKKTGIKHDLSEVYANHVTPIAVDGIFRNRRSIPENPFLSNYMAQNYFNGQKTTPHHDTYAQNPSPYSTSAFTQGSHVQNSSEENHFKKNPFLQNYTMINPSHRAQPLPNGGTTRNPWLHGDTPKPSSGDNFQQNPYSPVATPAPSIPIFAMQPPSAKPSSDLTQDVKSQNNKYISAMASSTTSSITQRTLMPKTTLRAPTPSPDLSQLIKNGAVIFPDSQYIKPTPTPSGLQEMIDIRRR